jgi:hypothetical protein
MTTPMIRTSEALHASNRMLSDETPVCRNGEIIANTRPREHITEL